MNYFEKQNVRKPSGCEYLGALTNGRKNVRLGTKRRNKKIGTFRVIWGKFGKYRIKSYKICK